jgi:hypothetical protein
MTRMRSIRLTFAFGVLTLAACGGESTPVQASDDLRRDLQLAGSSAIELVPNAARTQVVSEIEQAGAATAAPAPTKARAPVARPAPRRAAPTARVVRAPSPAPARPAAAREQPPVFGPDVISPPPPGGYKTVDEVIRSAPFPIKPARG